MLEKLLHRAREDGLLRALRRAPAYLEVKLALALTYRAHAQAIEAERFDPTYGTDTAGVLLPGRALKAKSSRSGGEISAYQPAMVSAIAEPLDSLHFDLSGFCFLDIGCGKGKPMLVASRYRFKRWLGIDISPVCVEAAQRNLAIRGVEGGTTARRLLCVA